VHLYLYIDVEKARKKKERKNRYRLYLYIDVEKARNTVLMTQQHTINDTNAGKKKCCGKKRLCRGSVTGGA